MNFLGMGLWEMAVIFLVAFLALGPNKSIEMARTTGRVLGDLRRTFNEVIAAATLDAEEPTASGSTGARNDAEPRDSSQDFPGDSRDAGR